MCFVSGLAFLERRLVLVHAACARYQGRRSACKMLRYPSFSAISAQRTVVTFVTDCAESPRKISGFSTAASKPDHGLKVLGVEAAVGRRHSREGGNSVSQFRLPL